jgi:hypothetical protein
MAAVTGAVIGGASALGGIYQSIQGAKQARDAQNALNSLPIPDLQNVYGGMQVSKMGNELISEQSQNRYAQNVDALRSGGIRGIIGGLGQANEMAKQTDLQIKADYDKQENEIAMSQAQDEANLRAMREQRYQGNVAALSSQVSAGKQQEMQGIHGAIQGLASGAQMYQQGKYMDALTAGTGGAKKISDITGKATSLVGPAANGLMSMARPQIGGSMDLSGLSGRGAVNQNMGNPMNPLLLGNPYMPNLNGIPMMNNGYDNVTR